MATAWNELMPLLPAASPCREKLPKSLRAPILNLKICTKCKRAVKYAPVPQSRAIRKYGPHKKELIASIVAVSLSRKFCMIFSVNLRCENIF